MAGLVIALALHLAHWLATLCLARSAIFAWTEVLWADHFAIRLTALHLATLGVEALATR